ncbi:MAG: 50S ribosomal protein L24 [Gammaproteobacteria bacterium]|nr:MAG: 50S ribosomal protein L24 [Gammaproteobacteria bacterium]
MNKIKKGDMVIVISGKDKNKTGTVLSVVGDKVEVEGVQVKKHVKANPNANQPGGILTKNRPIHRSNVMLYDGKKGSRVGIRALKDGQRVRYYKSNDQLVDIKE